MDRKYKLEVLCGWHGEPVQTTVVVYEDGEPTSITTKSVEPFVSWVEVMNDLLDGLPLQLKLL